LLYLISSTTIEASSGISLFTKAFSKLLSSSSESFFSGFATYRYLEDGKTVYIVDIYIIPELRKNGEAAMLADKIVAEAKERGCVELLGSVVPSMKNSTTSMKVLLGYGMSLSSAANDFIIFRKEI